MTRDFPIVPRRWLPAPVVRAAILRFGLLRRAMTLGTRVLAQDADGHVLLVRHTYVPGWHFPGGAIDVGESAEAAAVRELREETGLIAPVRPKLFGLYRNTAGAGRDHVALYALPPCPLAEPIPAAGEIAEARFFDRATLPAETTRATRARLAEVFDGVAPSETW